MENLNFSFWIEPTDPAAGIGFEIWLDQKLIKDIPQVDSKQLINLDLDLDYGSHKFSFVMKNKTAEHTVFDQDNNIVKDALLNISAVTIDDMNVNYAFWAQSKYYHDFNGSSDIVVEEFSDLMGCNGHIDVEFETPIYLWLLKIM